ncbi:MAG: fumarylacetoacetate hydrolase family protein [Eubacteriales bacterium]|nr:fumarylacetoacetate hydrolase family protein [Eubacteriales bacterium]
MRICRAELPDGSVTYAVIEGDIIKPVTGEPFEKIQLINAHYRLNDVRLLAPVTPSKIVCIGKNYYAHAMEMQEGVPDRPLLFIKPSTAVIGMLDDIIYPPDSNRVDYEAELAVVIGSRCRNVPMGGFRDVVLGYTCLNDVTARDIQKSDVQWTRGKSYDTFCPIGPWIETELDPFNVKVESRLNGELKQSASTATLMHNVDELVYYISRVMTLLPGDIISTGTPAGISGMQPGDVIDIEVEGIGLLRNYVKA